MDQFQQSACITHSDTKSEQYVEKNIKCNILMKRKKLLLSMISISVFLLIIISCEKRDFKLVAKVTTKPVSSFTATTAEVSGEITDIGNGIDHYGHCWSLKKDPTTTDSKTSLTTSLKPGTYSSTLQNLEPLKTYHFRAYVNSVDGVIYGNDQTFTTYGLLTISTTPASGITISSAIIGGNISDDGGSSVTDRGIIWRPSNSIDTAGAKIQVGSGKGSFTTSLNALLPNAVYYFKAYATNSLGTTYGMRLTFTTALGAPTNVSATKGNAQATVNFVPPLTNGGAEITGYRVTSSPGNLVATGPTSPIVVSSLVNGTSYTFTVVAFNANGNSAPSSPSNPVTPSTVPGSPTIGTAIAGNAQATISFSIPQNNGGSAITSYTVTSNPDGITATALSSPITITGLTNGSSYSFTVTAANINGVSIPSSPSNIVTPIQQQTVPGAPVIGQATKGNSLAYVTFTPPSNNGGSAITSYIVTSLPGNITATGTTSPITVTGLTNGTPYTFTVVAKNSTGNSAPSSSSNSIIPSTVPSIPTIGTATAGNAQASVSFTAPAGNGGSAIMTYTATSSPGGISATGTTSPITVFGLTNGVSYTFSVVATNVNGDSPPSTASNTIIPNPAPTVPDAPTIGTAIKGNAQASVSFTAPVNNGGSAITGYTVTSNPGGLIGTGSASPITVTGLTNGTTYTFTVVARNSIGNSSPSISSNPIIPSTVPGAPIMGSATKGNAQASVTFSSPLTNGGSVITSYTVTSNPGGFAVSGISSPITVTGLTNGVGYTFSVTAENANGTGLPSASSNSVIPSTIPGAPVIGTATPGNAQASVTFTAPSGNGGSAITGYTVTANPGGITAYGSVSPILINLTNGIGYTFTVTASNINGPGPSSSSSNIVIPTYVSIVYDVDNNLYHTTQIGSQVWMKENLKTTRYNDGTAIPLVTNSTSWYTATTPAYCWYNNDINSRDPYGALYNWYVLSSTTNGGKNACPSGFHVATDADWTILTDYLTNNGFGYGGSGNDIGKSLAATYGWSSSSTVGTIGNNQASNNSSGFTSYPIGDRSPIDGTFYTISTDGTWWTSTSSNASFAYFVGIKSSSAVVTRSDYNKQSGFAVRCIKD
jgi:uncharacterized protein (TIGR02145 family)